MANVLLWILAGTLLGAYRVRYSFDDRFDTAAVLTAIDLGVLLGCSLLLNHRLIPRLLYRGKRLLFVICALLAAVVCVYAIQTLQHLWYSYARPLSDDDAAILRTPAFQVFNSWMIVVPGAVCLIAYRLVSDHLLTRSRYEELQKEKAQTELSFLKAQINPHFLFNSLNSIYAHIDRSNTIARSIVLGFSEMLRYQLYECNSEFIPIEKEISYLRHYIELQQIRMNENLRITVEMDAAGLAEFQIAPLLLIPFVENAFKYASTHEHIPNLLNIEAHRQDEAFIFRCMNTKDHPTSRSLVEDSGVGIRNVRRRLELLYPDAHMLDIQDTETTFTVVLTLAVK